VAQGKKNDRGLSMHLAAERSQFFSASPKILYIIDRENIIYQFHINVMRKLKNSEIASRKPREMQESVLKSLWTFMC
jgi:hypothetical protein